MEKTMAQLQQFKLAREQGRKVKHTKTSPFLTSMIEDLSHDLKGCINDSRFVFEDKNTGIEVHVDFDENATFQRETPRQKLAENVFLILYPGSKKRHAKMFTRETGYKGSLNTAAFLLAHASYLLALKEAEFLNTFLCDEAA